MTTTPLENSAASSPDIRAAVDSLLERGFHVIENALSPEACRLAANLLDELVAAGVGREQSGAGGFGNAIHPLVTRDARFSQFYSDATLLAILTALFDDAPRLVHTGARVSDATHTARLGWHHHRYVQDRPEPPGTRGVYPVRVLTACYVEGCTPQSGPLVVLPRRYDDLLAPLSEEMGSAWPGEVAVSCPPGSCVIFTTDLWHAALGGTGSACRHLFGAHWQGWDNPRVHPEDNLVEASILDECVRLNPAFGGLVRR